MDAIKTMKLCKTALRLVLAVVLAVLFPTAPVAAGAFDVGLWPDGVVKFRFLDDANNSSSDCSEGQTDLELCLNHKVQVLQMMGVWEAALRTTDPLGHRVSYVHFQLCTNDCGTSHVIVRYNNRDAAGNLTQNGNMCTYFEGGVEKVGRNPNGPTVLHFRNTGNATRVQPDSVVLHELGHCLGLWHEQNRADVYRWLDFFPIPLFCAANRDACDDPFFAPEIRPANLLPLLGNFDYNSIMLYGSYTAGGELRYADPWGNTFLGNTWQTDFAPARPNAVSARDISRVLQYQAREYSIRNGRDWGFFGLINPAAPPGDLPNPYLDQARRIYPVGTPAITFESPGNFDIFSRGNDHKLYWKSYRRELVRIGFVNGKPVLQERNTVSDWQSIGCCFASDPSAVVRAPGRIDVVAVNDDGAVQRIKYIDGIWAEPLTLRGGAPADGIKAELGSRYVGPAIASRGTNLLDVFVVRSDGRLAVTTWRDNAWEAWQTLGQLNSYNVTARPAALALSASEVKVAINEGDENLYEPMVTFGAGAPAWVLGSHKGIIEYKAPPALTALQGGASNNRYRVAVTNEYGRISIRDAAGAWREVGGIPKYRTGPAAVATGDLTFMAIMRGEDATSCTAPFCHTDVAISNEGQLIQPGGLWIRKFD